MGISKNFVVTDGPGAGVQVNEILIGVPLVNAATLAVGTPILRDITALPGGMLPRDANASKLFYNSAVGDRGVLATSASAGDVIGVYQGVGSQGTPYTNNSGATAIYVATCRMQGIARVLAGAVAAGSAVTIGSSLIVSNSNVFATVGTRAIGVSIGRVIAYTINTSSPTSVSAGSQTVTPTSIVGITTSTALVIDNGTQQEVVVPTAVSATSGTFTANFAIPHNNGFSIQGINNIVGATIIGVPNSGATTGVVLADLNGIS
jgi:hypothetical protein